MTFMSWLSFSQRSSLEESRKRLRQSTRQHPPAIAGVVFFFEWKLEEEAPCLVGLRRFVYELFQIAIPFRHSHPEIARQIRGYRHALIPFPVDDLHRLNDQYLERYWVGSELLSNLGKRLGSFVAHCFSCFVVGTSDSSQTHITCCAGSLISHSTEPARKVAQVGEIQTFLNVRFPKPATIV